MKKFLSRKSMLRALALVLAAVQLFTGSVCVRAAEYEPIVALGADLSAEQRAVVLGLMNLQEEDLSRYTVINITNDQEHQYLDAYLPASVIGTRSLSSVLVSPMSSGSGLQIVTHNISYCTESMYRNALLTAGLENAEVIVAAPTNISGTAALIGAVKAYESMTGEPVADDVLETATEELVVTGELGESLGDSEQASEIVAYIKQQIVETGADTPEEIEAIIRDATQKFNINISEEDMKKIESLMQKIGSLDLDVEALKEQAQDLYKKLQDMDINIDSEKVGNFFTRLLEEIVGFFQRLFS